MEWAATLAGLSLSSEANHACLTEKLRGGILVKGDNHDCFIRVSDCSIRVSRSLLQVGKPWAPNYMYESNNTYVC